jgi:hypothetical protein
MTLADSKPDVAIPTGRSCVWTRSRSSWFYRPRDDPAKPRLPARQDYEYERNDVANLLHDIRNLRGLRLLVKITNSAAPGYEQMPKELSDETFPEAGTIALAKCNLSTHTAVSLRDLPRSQSASPRQLVRVAFRTQARGLARFAEFELATATTQFLIRRFPEKQTLKREVAAWQERYPDGPDRSNVLRRDDLKRNRPLKCGGR